MKAAVLHRGRVSVEDVADPTPSAGQALVRPLCCGVCGSDLHARDHAEHLCDLLHRSGFRGFMDPDRPAIMGHEFCAELIDWGPGTERRWHAGQRVVALPFLEGPQGVELLGYSNRYPGAFSEAMLLQDAMMFAVPDEVPATIAALTEPLSVAVHAVNVADADADCVFAVYGCGPVGLFVIARLRALGLGPILAIDPNPARRDMAARMGADIAIVPDGAAAEAWWQAENLHRGLSDTMAAQSRGKVRRPVIFECVGKPGMLAAIAEGAPVGGIVVVVGVCMERDAIEPALMIQKSIQLRFTFAYAPAEFADAFAMVCARPEVLAPLVTEKVGLHAVNDAFDALTAGGAQVKVMVEPTANRGC